MTGNLDKHKATTQQDARLPSTPRENIDDRPEVERDKSEETTGAGAAREENGTNSSQTGI